MGARERARGPGQTAGGCTLPANIGLAQDGAPGASPQEAGKELARRFAVGAKPRPRPRAGRPMAISDTFRRHEGWQVAPDGPSLGGRAAPAGPELPPAPGPRTPLAGPSPAAPLAGLVGSGGALSPIRPTGSLVAPAAPAAAGAGHSLRIGVGVGIGDWRAPRPSAAPHAARPALSDPRVVARSARIEETLRALAAHMEAHLCRPGQPLYDLVVDLYGRQHPAEGAYEVGLALSGLKGFARVNSYLEQPELMSTMASLMPKNMPLYALVLYGIMPAALCAEVAIHLPQGKRPLFAAIYGHVARAAQEAFGQSPHRPKLPPEVDPEACLRLPHMGLVHWSLPPPPDGGVQGACPGSHSAFIAHHRRDAALVMITGHYDNAEAVARTCAPDTVVAYNSSGINPAIVGGELVDPDAPATPCTSRQALSNIARRLVKARMLNNGQDCGGPDAILVQKIYLVELVEMLKLRLDEMGYGRHHRAIDNETQFDEARDFIDRHYTHKKTIPGVVHGGDTKNSTKECEPTIVVRDLKSFEKKPRFVEFYAPVFNVLFYEHDADLGIFFDADDYKKRSMFVSVFGSSHFAARLHINHTYLSNETVIDADSPFQPYGGYGPQASGCLVEGRTLPKPIQPLQVVADRLQQMAAHPQHSGPKERTQRATDAFGDIAHSLRRHLDDGLLWHYFWQDGSLYQPRPQGQAHAHLQPGSLPPALVDNEALGVLFIVRGEKERRLVFEALRSHHLQDDGRLPSKPCVARHLAALAGLNLRAAHRTYISTIGELGEKIARVPDLIAAYTGALSRGVQARAVTSELLGVDGIHTLGLVEGVAVEANKRRGARACPPEHRPLVRQAESLRKKLAEMTLSIYGHYMHDRTKSQPCIEEPDLSTHFKGTISFAQIQQLCTQPKSLPHDGRHWDCARAILGCSPQASSRLATF